MENICQKTGKQVVVLIDEYDKPLLDTMNVNPVQEGRSEIWFSEQSGSGCARKSGSRKSDFIEKYGL